jgi:hypothetical protein
MSSPALDQDVARPPRALNVVLWIGQVILFCMFMFAGGFKLAKPMLGVEQGHLPYWLVIFIGVCEVAGALGVILPGLTRVKPGLVPLAALGLATIMVLATLLHLSRGEGSHAVTTVILLVIALFVAWGRWKKAPFRPRTA